MQKKVRVGIDVGGTYTDAVVIDNKTNQIIAKEKIKTTHLHEDGVAKGITDIVSKVLEDKQIDSEDVMFIAHGTTQATNALLEGDVAKVGVIGMADNKKDSRKTIIEDIELSQGKLLKVTYEYLLSSEVNEKNINKAIDNLTEKGAQVIVASEAYSIENSENEELVEKCATRKGKYVTSGHVISQLFGLKIRTRTAIINGSLIPKMIETADMTEKVVKSLGIPSDLMVMRADGGVMSVDEVRKRPILTMLSGLAAGVAGALMYEKVSDGIFLEIGGTSIDVSVIKDGKVMIKNAQVGDYKTYLKSLDIRTLGIAGGTMIRINNRKIKEIGPRSAHLAGLPYEAFEVHNQKKVSISTVSPLNGDPDDYVVGVDSNDNKYAFTLAGAANYLELIEQEDYAFADKENFRHFWDELGNYFGSNGEDIAREAIRRANEKIWEVVSGLIDEYELNQDFITLVGGGGSASVLTKALGEQYNLKYKVAKNAPYISTIGVALAMLREEIERSVVNPTESDIKKIRHEVVDKLIAMGALEDTIEVSINVDSSKHVIRAVATGATEFKSDEGSKKRVSAEELKSNVAESINTNKENVHIKFESDRFKFIETEERYSGIKKFFKRKKKYIFVTDNEGVIHYRRENGTIIEGQKNNYQTTLHFIYDNYSTFNDAGETIPEIFMFSGSRVFNYSGLVKTNQIENLIKMDLEFYDDTEKLYFLVTRR